VSVTWLFATGFSATFSVFVSSDAVEDGPQPKKNVVTPQSIRIRSIRINSPSNREEQQKPLGCQADNRGVSELTQKLRGNNLPDCGGTYALNLILAELRKQSGELMRDKNRTARAVPLKCFNGLAKKG